MVRFTRMRRVWPLMDCTLLAGTSHLPFRDLDDLALRIARHGGPQRLELAQQALRSDRETS